MKQGHPQSLRQAVQNTTWHLGTTSPRPKRLARKREDGSKMPRGKSYPFSNSSEGKTERESSINTSYIWTILSYLWSNFPCKDWTCQPYPIPQQTIKPKMKYGHLRQRRTNYYHCETTHVKSLPNKYNKGN